MKLANALLMLKTKFCSTILLLLVYVNGAFGHAADPASVWQIIKVEEQNRVQSRSSATNQQKNANVVIHQSVLASLTKGQKYAFATPEGELILYAESQSRTANTDIWTLRHSEQQSLLQAKLFIGQNGVSAWIPTQNGVWRLEDGVLSKEMRWASSESDVKRRPVDNTSADSTSVNNSPASVDSAASTLSEAPAIIKVLFVTTPEFEAYQLAPDDYLTQLVTINNAIYAASGVNIELQIGARVSADLDEYNADQILDNLAKSGANDSTYGDIDDALMMPIWQARLAAGADIVTVMRHTLPDGLCGKSWLNGNALQAFDYRFAVNLVALNTRFTSGNVQLCSSDTLGHEIGHNLGLDHAEAQGGEGTVFSWGRGYGVVDQFSTVMAYPQAFGDAVAVPYFSSPELPCLAELPCGLPADGADGADAVRAMNAVALRVAQTHNESVTLPADQAIAGLDSALISCLEESEDSWLSNEEIDVINCPQANVASLSGIERFPRLQFLSVNNTEVVSLEGFKYLNEIIALDFRYTAIEDLRPIVHLKDQLQFLQFFTTNMTCQDEAVVESWNIDRLLSHGECLPLETDLQDFDGDGLSNLLDTDDDNDGIDDLSDALPFDAANADDSDADGVPDNEDAFPYDSNEWSDADGDTIGDNQDPDRDNDGILNEADCAPLDKTRGDDCAPVTQHVAFDYDGDGKADVAVRRASNAMQYILNSTDGEIQRIELGKDPGDIAVSGDFDGDGIADVAVRRPSNKLWYIAPSSGGELMRIEFGLQSEDIPVPADYDGDGITDIAVRRPSTQQWFIRLASDQRILRYSFGQQAEDIPTPGDYDGDGKADIAVRRPSTKFWYILSSRDESILRYQFGMQDEDIAVPGDYDGDGQTDLAIRRPSEHAWYIQRSSDEQIIRIEFGRDQYDIPVIADYDGDGKDDIAVRRPASNMQYILRSSDMEIERVLFGLDNYDMPIAAPVMVRFANQLQFDNYVEEQEVAEVRTLSIVEAQSAGLIKP